MNRISRKVGATVLGIGELWTAPRWKRRRNDAGSGQHRRPRRQGGEDHAHRAHSTAAGKARNGEGSARFHQNGGIMTV